MCVLIVLCFSVYVLFYRIYFESQTGTSSHCHNEDIDDVNETIDLDHDVEGLEEVLNLPRDILETLNRESKESKPNIEETKMINLADEDEKEIFAWSYQDMPRLDTNIFIHRILVKPEWSLVRQALRRMKSEIILKIKKEVEKQLKAGFLTTIAYLD